LEERLQGYKDGIAEMRATAKFHEKKNAERIEKALRDNFKERVGDLIKNSNEELHNMFSQLNSFEKEMRHVQNALLKMRNIFAS